MAKRHKNPSDRPGNDGSAGSGARPPAPHLGGPLGSSGAAPGSPDPVVSPSGEELPEPTAPEGSERAAASEATPAASKGADAESKAGLSKDEDPAADSRDVDVAGNAKAGDAKADVTAKAESAAGKDGDAEAAAEKGSDGKTSDGKTDAGERPADKTADGEAAKDKAAKDDEGDGSKDDEGDGGKKDGVDVDLDKPVVVTTGTASGKRVTRVLRRANPIKAARSATRTTSAWARKPSGRLLIPAVAAALLIGAAGAAGAYLVPKALESGVAPSRSPGFPLDQAAGGPVVPTGGAGLPLDPSGGAFNNPLVPPVGATRPADALQGWAQSVGTRVGIPVVAVQAYGYAELVAARTAPNCHLSWTTLAAIAKVESSHGSANGAVLNADGSVQPPIYGLPLDGKGSRQLIADTDKGVLDGDSTFDRAVGPLQFIPATWQETQVDADNSGASDPNDIDDASLAAALYLCKGGRDLSKADAWWDAILTYNAVRPYAQKVFDAANEYGQRSRV